MGEVLKTWLRTRLGVIIDLSPDIFGHYARDGTLLAKLLHSYDIINDSQLKTLNRTQDPALARVNLKSLRIWLRFIGVDCDDECMEDVSNGKGTTALRLFYKVFLCLENKDTLHFVTLQKEREKYIPSSSKFDVTTVNEETRPWAPEDHPLATPLKKNANLIDWHRKKYRELIDGCKKERDKFRSPQRGREVVQAKPQREETARRTKKKKTRSLVEETEKREADDFAKKHRVEKTTRVVNPCDDMSKTIFDGAKAPRVDGDAARAYTESLRSKHRREALTRSFKNRMQKTLLAELWEQVCSDREMELDEIVARKVLDQSQYEKQLMRKMCDVRREKSRMAGNRLIVEELLQSTRESEERLEQERAREVLVRESEEVEAESRRMRELERKIREEVVRKRKMKIRKMGEDVVNDLVDISVKAAEYKVASNDENVPRSLWNEWKALFVKSQPIVGASDSVVLREIEEIELRGEGDEEDAKEEMVEDVDPERNDLLNEDDFQNYHNMRSPWKSHVPNVDMEIREFMNHGLVALGYVVHKILESLYPRSQPPVETPLKRMKIRAAIVGIPDSVLYETIRELLEFRRIRLVRMEEAINYCLEKYKEEMRDSEHIDLDIIAAAKEDDDVKTNGSGTRSKKREKKSASSRAKTVSSIHRMDHSRTGVDKPTQTPRVIPYEDLDPSLTDSAYIGKWTHEFLTLGTPLSDELNSRIIVEYLKSLEDVDGFVLVDYPKNYQQMTTLEFALTGRKLPEDINKHSTDTGENNIEEIDPVASRISFESQVCDPTTGNWRKSRLVPNPIEQSETFDGNSFFTSYVKIKPKLDLKIEDNQRCEFVAEDAKSLDVFLAEQAIASIFYYRIFDLATLERLVRLVTNGENDATRISSSELLGEAAEDFFVGREDYTSGTKAPIVKKLLSKLSDCSLVESGSSKWSGRSEEKEVIEQIFMSSKSREGPARPGEADWSWADFSLPRQLLESLAALWQSLETSYIDELKEEFCLKRRNFGAVVPYANFVDKHMREYIERPDDKQDRLHEFHRAFNEMDEDIREDLGVKHELHCRVADLQTQLWETCNLRRKEAVEEMKRIVLDHWTTQESIILANVYTGIIQAEIDRYTDTLQFIQDYYLSMLQRSLQEPPSFRVKLLRIPFETSTSGSKEDILPIGNVASKSNKDGDSREARVKLSGGKIDHV